MICVVLLISVIYLVVWIEMSYCRFLAYILVYCRIWFCLPSFMTFIVYCRTPRLREFHFAKCATFEYRVCIVYPVLMFNVANLLLRITRILNHKLLYSKSR